MENILLELIKMVKYTVIHSFEKEGLFCYESFLLINIRIYNILIKWQIHFDIYYFALVFIVSLSFTYSFVIYKMM